MRETSSSDSTRSASRSPLCAARCNFFATRWPESSMRSFNVSSCSCNTVSGVFSSWAASDRNSSRRRIASVAFARLRRSSSRRRRSVRSRVTFA